MTTSTGKTLKRKHEVESVKTDEDVKKVAVESKSEITITPIAKKQQDIVA